MTRLGQIRPGPRWPLLAHLAAGLLAQPNLGLFDELHSQTCLATAGPDPTVAIQIPESGVGAALHRFQQLVLCYSQAARAPVVLSTKVDIGRTLSMLKADTSTFSHVRTIAPFRSPIAI